MNTADAYMPPVEEDTEAAHHTVMLNDCVVLAGLPLRLAIKHMEICSRSPGTWWRDGELYLGESENRMWIKANTDAR